MVPLALINIIVVAIVAKLLRDAEASTGTEAVVLLAANLIMIAGVYVTLSYAGRRARRQEDQEGEVVAEVEAAAAH